MKNFVRLFSAITIGFIAILCGYFLNSFINEEKLTVPRTDTYKPSVRWDHNWDRYFFVVAKELI